MLKLEYIAGLFDGEGYIRIFKKVQKNHVGYYISAGVGMCHRPIIEALHQKFGGSLDRGRGNENPKHRPTFCWSVANKNAASFLNEILPYLSIKQEEAKIAL